MRIRTAGGVAAAVTAALLLAGCSSGSGTSTSTSSTGAGGGGASAGGTLGLSLSTLSNPFFVSVRDGAQKEASAKGYKLSISDSQNDPATQANAVQNFITQQVKAIIINPTDSDAVVPSVKAANNANIPVIAVDRGANGGKVATTVASDNVTGGKLAADALAKAIGGSGEVVELQGSPGTSAANDRGKGFDEQIATYRNIKVVAKQAANFDRAKALDVMTNLLQAHPNIKGVFAQNDEMALGAIKALGAKAGSAIKVVGFDGTQEGLAAVKAGTEAADVAQQPALLGKMAVDNAIDVIMGKSVQPSTQVPVKVVTKETVDSFTSGS